MSTQEASSGIVQDPRLQYNAHIVIKKKLCSAQNNNTNYTRELRKLNVVQNESIYLKISHYMHY